MLKQQFNYFKPLLFCNIFQQAQKPWAKRLTKVIAAKKDYHAACRTEKSTANQENNARGDTTVSQDQVALLFMKSGLHGCDDYFLVYHLSFALLVYMKQNRYMLMSQRHSTLGKPIHAPSP